MLVQLNVQLCLRERRDCINCETTLVVLAVTLRNFGKAPGNIIVAFTVLGSSFSMSTNVCLTGLNSPFTKGGNFISRTVVVMPVASLASVFLETVHSTCTITIVVLEANSFFNLKEMRNIYFKYLYIIHEILSFNII